MCRPLTWFFLLSCWKTLLDTLLSRELLKAVADGAENVSVVVSYLPTVVTHLQCVHRWIQCTGHPLTRMPFRRSIIHPLKSEYLVIITQTSGMFCVRRPFSVTYQFQPATRRTVPGCTRCTRMWFASLCSVGSLVSAMRMLIISAS